MFFVVYFKAAKQHLVVPAIYVYKMDDVFQKFMNYSCNSNQMFLFHHPLNGYENAENIEPNFHAGISEEFKIDEEFCFKGKIVKYFNDYADAIEYKNRLRPNDPAVYNENRLNEQPIPPTEPIPDEIEQVFVEATENLDEENVQQEKDESIQIKQEPELLIMNESDEMEFERILHGDIDETPLQDVSGDILNLSLEDSAEPTEQVNLLVEQEAPAMTSASDLNQSDETILDATDLNGKDDEIVFEETGSFPKPMVCTENVLSKHEDDPISGNLSYASKKNGDRIFMVAKAKVIISKSILDKIRAWATPPFHQKLSIDKCLVQLLLVKLVGMMNLATRDISDSVKEFIYEFLRSRIGLDDFERIGHLEQHIEEICAHYAKEKK